MAAKKSFLLRLDPRLYDELQSWAADELRSVNGQIEYLLAAAVKAKRRKSFDETGPDAPEEGKDGF